VDFSRLSKVPNGVFSEPEKKLCTERERLTSELYKQSRVVYETLGDL
jgi:hypothetical protein